ncbi:MAG: hypothetical protein LBH71_02345 [Oscillospiraceae bacterium]|jgi:hypothetical protein|nr:hypothetical protein [Oscillospiraceae bacterium]
MQNKRTLNTVISIAVSLLLISYLAYQGYLIAYNPVKTQVAYEHTIYDSADTEIFVVRDEKYLIKNANGTIVPIVEDGKRVANGQEVAIVFSNNDAAANYIRINELETSISRYKKLAAQAESFTIDIETIDNDINLRLLAYLDVISSGKLEQIKDGSAALRDKMTTRQTATGVQIDFNSKISELTKQLDKLKKKSSDHKSITADQAGYYINRVDGFETLVPYGKAESLSVSDIERIQKAKEKQTPSNAMGKLVNDFDWYLVCNVDSKNIGSLSIGDTIKVFLPFASTSEIFAQVASLNGGNSPKTAVILRCNHMDSQLANLRKQTASLIFNEHTGLKVPISAVRVNADGEKGVYVLMGNMVKFRKIEVTYTSDDFIIASKKNSEDGYLKQYDNVIFEGSDLFDGKIVKK